MDSKAGHGKLLWSLLLTVTLTCAAPAAFPAPKNHAEAVAGLKHSDPAERAEAVAWLAEQRPHGRPAAAARAPARRRRGRARHRRAGPVAAVDALGRRRHRPRAGRGNGAHAATAACRRRSRSSARSSAAGRPSPRAGTSAPRRISSPATTGARSPTASEVIKRNPAAFRRAVGLRPDLLPPRAVRQGDRVLAPRAAGEPEHARRARSNIDGAEQLLREKRARTI